MKFCNVNNSNYLHTRNMPCGFNGKINIIMSDNSMGSGLIFARNNTEFLEPYLNHCESWGSEKVAIPEYLCRWYAITYSKQLNLTDDAWVISGCMFYKTRLSKLHVSISDSHMTAACTIMHVPHSILHDLFSHHIYLAITTLNLHFATSIFFVRNEMKMKQSI